MRLKPSIALLSIDDFFDSYWYNNKTRSTVKVIYHDKHFYVINVDRHGNGMDYLWTSGFKHKHDLTEKLVANGFMVYLTGGVKK